MERRESDRQRKQQDVIAFRKRCTPGGTGLTHYILPDDAPKSLMKRGSSKRRAPQSIKL